MPDILYAGDKLLGTLTYEDMDWPRYYFQFDPAPEFETYRRVLDLQGSPRATEENIAAAGELDLRVVSEDGECIRPQFIFIDGRKATIRQGFIREEPQARAARHDVFWNVLESEVGPETCREQGCSHLRIGLSIFCKRHHFRMVVGEDYEGTQAES